MNGVAQSSARPSPRGGRGTRPDSSLLRGVRGVLIGLLVFAPGAGPAVHAADPTAPVVAPESRSVGLRGGIQPLLEHLQRPGSRAIVLVSLPGCGFCTLVRERHLGPLRADPAYDDVPAYEISLSDHTGLPPLPDAWQAGSAGGARDVAGFARTIGATVAPTVLFLGHAGARVEPLVGYASDDFYWAYLSERIDRLRADPAR